MQDELGDLSSEQLPSSLCSICLQQSRSDVRKLVLTFNVEQRGCNHQQRREPKRAQQTPAFLALIVSIALENGSARLESTSNGRAGLLRGKVYPSRHSCSLRRHLRISLDDRTSLERPNEPASLPIAAVIASGNHARFFPAYLLRARPRRGSRTGGRGRKSGRLWMEQLGQPRRSRIQQLHSTIILHSFDPLRPFPLSRKGQGAPAVACGARRVACARSIGGTAVEQRQRGRCMEQGVRWQQPSGGDWRSGKS